KSTGTKETFRTDVPQDYDNYWRMFRNGTEYGRFINFDNAFAFYIQAPRGNLRLASGNTGTAIPSFEIVGSSGSNAGFVGIGDYSTYTAQRLLDVYSNSNNPQLRITHTESTKFTDLQTTNAGDFIIIPTTTSSVPAQVGIGTTTPDSPLEVHSPTATSGTQSTLRIENMLGSSSGTKMGVDIEVQGANTQLIAIKSSVPASSSSGDTYGILHTDYNSGANATGMDFDIEGVNTASAGIILRVKNDNTASATSVSGIGCDVIGSTPAAYGISQNTGTDANNGYVIGIKSIINTTLDGGDQTNYAFFGLSEKPNSFYNVGIFAKADFAAQSIGVWGQVPTTTSCSGGSLCSNMAVYSDGYAFTNTAAWYSSSDSSIKTNIQPLTDYWNILENINGYRYEYDTSLNSTTNLNLASGTNVGLIAQEVENVLPEVVREFIAPGSIESDGTVKNDYQVKAIGYTGLIPVLVEAIKDLKAQIDSLIANSSSQRLMNDSNTPENQITKSEIVNNQKIVLSNQQGIILSQNDPNPFTESTRITFQIPDEVKDAKIIFTSTTGAIINTAIINERGAGELEVYSSELSKGLYNYTLVCDGKVIASKKMLKQ
ncbi:MAG: tail fiber domain-containing protein, partial [Saprospiraceae bacterium]|nr:tail fiber domain-containing protein [Saprospiraceae bacterium]